MPLPLPLLPGRGQPPKHRGCLISARAVVAQPLSKAPLSRCWVSEAHHLLDGAHRLVIHAFRSASEELCHPFLTFVVYRKSPDISRCMILFMSMNRCDICPYPSSPPFKALCFLIRGMHGADQCEIRMTDTLVVQGVSEGCGIRWRAHTVLVQVGLIATSCMACPSPAT